MPVVRARLGDKGELATCGMPVFGAELVGREVELLNRVGKNSGVRPRYAEIVLIDSVHGKVIFAGTGTADGSADTRDATGLRYGVGSQNGQVQHASVERPG
jgi:hypothetical protein